MLVTIVGDTVDELDELVVVSFTNPTNTTMGGFFGLGFGTITDDDLPPKVVPGIAAQVTESCGSCVSVVEIPVSLSSPSALPVSASWVALNDGATPLVELRTRFGVG